MIIRQLSWLAVGLWATVVVGTAAAQSGKPWITYEGKSGPGNGKHIVLVSGDEEYRSEESLPQLGKILSQRHGFKCTVLFPIDPETGKINPMQQRNIPGLHHLGDADLMVIFTRFRELPDDQMRHIESYLEQGGPVVGLRTATHAFQFDDRKETSFRHYGDKYDGPKEAWHGGFGQVVLGENWVAHYGANHEEATRGIIADKAEDHPVLNGIGDGEVFAHSGAYFVEEPLPGDSELLLRAQVVDGMGFEDPPVEDERNEPMSPLAWVKTYDLPGDGKQNRGRVLTTTLGANVDLRWEGTRRLLVNGCLWCLGMEVPEKANVALVGEYNPTPYGFDGHKEGMKPQDYPINVNKGGRNGVTTAKSNIDHAEIISNWDEETLKLGKHVYRTSCFACHGMDGSGRVPNARSFTQGELQNGAGPYSLFKTISNGYKKMPSQSWLTPRERYAVIHYLRETFLKEENPEQYTEVTDAYLSGLPEAVAGETTARRQQNVKDAAHFGGALASQLGADIPSVLTVGVGDDVTVSYNLHRMRTAGTWRGGFLNLSETKFRQLRGEGRPLPEGRPLEGLQDWYWAFGDRLDQSKLSLEPRSPAPDKWMTYNGRYTHGRNVILSYAINGREILEMPGAEQGPDFLALHHTLRVNGGDRPLELVVGEVGDPAYSRSGVMKLNAKYPTRPYGPASERVAVAHTWDIGIENPLFQKAKPEEPSGGSAEPWFEVSHEETQSRLNMDEDFSVAVRFRTDESGTLVANAPKDQGWDEDAAGRNGKSLYVNAQGGVTFDIGYVGAVSGGEYLTDGAWHQVVVTSENGRARLFVDGRMVAEKNDFSAPLAEGHVFRIGATTRDFGGNFTGEIDRVRFYSKPLDEAIARAFSNEYPEEGQEGLRQGLMAKAPEPDFDWSPGEEKSGETNEITETPDTSQTVAVRDLSEADAFVAAAVVGETDGLTWRVDSQGRIILSIPAGDKPRVFRVMRFSEEGLGELDRFRRYVTHVSASESIEDPKTLTQAGPNPFDETVQVQGKLGRKDRAYVVDTIPVPIHENPYGAWVRPSAVAFFEDGRAAVTTYTGDVWIVSGIDQSLEAVTWRRFAAGLYEPFGARVIDGTLYVTCRDGIKRLHDMDSDGFADYIEHFFADPDVSTFFHSFAFGLERDKQGNLYYTKAGQYTSYKLPGSVIKVSPDGEDYEVVATGFRTPAGTGMFPYQGEQYLTVADNEGNWMPSSKISVIEQGGFYGYSQTLTGGEGRWQPDGGKIDPGEVEPPETFDQPMLWLPREVDNSSGSLVHVDDERFGPLVDHIIHSSYGAAQLFYILPQKLGDRWQGGAVPLPQKYDSGVQRVRVNPTDGQVYTVGLNGWDNPPGSDEGCFQRLRYTGKDFRMIDSMAVTSTGLKLTFNFSVSDRAANPENFQVAQWHYKWNEQYGSPRFHPDTGEEGQEVVAVESVRLGATPSTLYLKLSDLQTVHQMRVKMNVPTKKGEPFEEDLYLTINKIPSESSR